MCMCMHVCMFVCMYVNACVYVYVHTHTHTHTHTRTHARTHTYYLGNIYRRLFNPSYLGCFSVDFKKQGAFRKLLSIPYHLPPSTLFYLFSFRNGKQSRKTIRIRQQEKWNQVLDFMTARHFSLPFRFRLFWPYCRHFFPFCNYYYFSIMPLLPVGQCQAILTLKKACTSNKLIAKQLGNRR